MRINPSQWCDKSVFITGHTGFKGGWLALWLHQMGANVHGYSIDPPSDPALFDVADVSSVMAEDVRADLADLEALKSALKSAKPDVVFHLAAQPLVRDSYENPINTFATNIMGTANLLEAVREINSVRAVIIVTTDKVYENDEQQSRFVEDDPLGGHDPYSASKAAAEIITASCRASFYNVKGGHPAQVATARAGNVIGGGDWANDRIIPDCVRSFTTGQPVILRYPNAVRPWQHVLEPLSGYLNLAEKLLSENGSIFAKSWNFGPNDNSDASVHCVAETAARIWGQGASVTVKNIDDQPHEMGQLKLDSTLARKELGWKPQWDLQQALEQTISWYRQWQQGADMKAACLEQINTYISTPKI